MPIPPFPQEPNFLFSNGLKHWSRHPCPIICTSYDPWFTLTRGYSITCVPRGDRVYATSYVNFSGVPGMSKSLAKVRLWLTTQILTRRYASRFSCFFTHITPRQALQTIQNTKNIIALRFVNMCSVFLAKVLCHLFYQQSYFLALDSLFPTAPLLELRQKCFLRLKNL